MYFLISSMSVSVSLNMTTLDSELKSSPSSSSPLLLLLLASGFLVFWVCFYSLNPFCLWWSEQKILRWGFPSCSVFSCHWRAAVQLLCALIPCYQISRRRRPPWRWPWPKTSDLGSAVVSVFRFFWVSWRAPESSLQSKRSRRTLCSRTTTSSARCSSGESLNSETNIHS